MPSFDDIGLRDELLRTLEEEEMDRPTALQAAVLPTLRRGGNVVARASSGSGKTLAYGLGVLDRLRPETPASEEEDGGAATRMVVLTPTREGAERIALTLAPYVQSVGFAIAAAGGAWGTPLAAAEVVAGTPADVMDAVRSSTLKFDRLEALVVDSLVRGLARELADDGIRVNGVRPGIIDTEIHASAGQPDRAKEAGPTLPMGRVGTPDEVADWSRPTCTNVGR